LKFDSAEYVEFAASARYVVLLEIVLGGFVAVGFFFGYGAQGAKSAIYGSLISVLLTVVLIWGVRRATYAARKNKNEGAVLLYVGAALRFVLAFVRFGLGLALFGLLPIPMIAGFCISQMGYVFQMRRQRPRGNTAGS
jgi:F0F1-type ATP synthase assembly protein I